MVDHDWDALRACLRPDVVRNGPFRDEYRGRDDYVAFLRELMPSLPGYSMEVARVTYADGGRHRVRRARGDGDRRRQPLRTEESLVFELDADGHIARIDIFIKTDLVETDFERRSRP